MGLLAQAAHAETIDHYDKGSDSAPILPQRCRGNCRSSAGKIGVNCQPGGCLGHSAVDSGHMARYFRDMLA